MLIKLRVRQIIMVTMPGNIALGMVRDMGEYGGLDEVEKIRVKLGVRSTCVRAGFIGDDKEHRVFVVQRGRDGKEPTMVGSARVGVVRVTDHTDVRHGKAVMKKQSYTPAAGAITSRAPVGPAAAPVFSPCGLIIRVGPRFAKADHSVLGEVR